MSYQHGESVGTTTRQTFNNLGGSIDEKLRRLRDLDRQIDAELAAKKAELNRIEAAKLRLTHKATYAPSEAQVAAVTAMNIPTHPRWSEHRRALIDELDSYETRGKYDRTKAANSTNNSCTNDTQYKEGNDEASYPQESAQGSS